MLECETESDRAAILSEGLLTPLEAAEFARCGLTKIYDLVATREVKSVKVGRSRKILRASLADYLTRCVIR